MKLLTSEEEALERPVAKPRTSGAFSKNFDDQKGKS